MKGEKILTRFKFTLFNITLLFAKVLLERIINIILKHIYEGKEIITSIFETGMKELLLSLAKNIHFTYQN